MIRRSAALLFCIHLPGYPSRRRRICERNRFPFTDPLLSVQSVTGRYRVSRLSDGAAARSEEPVILYESPGSRIVCMSRHGGTADGKVVGNRQAAERALPGDGTAADCQVADGEPAQGPDADGQTGKRHRADRGAANGNQSHRHATKAYGADREAAYR